MEEFLNQFLDFVDKGTDWKENNETTNSQVINHFIANNDKLVTELVDTLCEGKESSDELGDCNMPRVTNRTLKDALIMALYHDGWADEQGNPKPIHNKLGAPKWVKNAFELLT